MGEQSDLPLAKKLGTGAMWSTINQAAHQILVLVVFLITARFISIEAFGVMAVCLLIIEAFRQIMAESIATYIYAKKDPAPADYNAGFALVLGGSVTAAVILYALSGFLADILNQPDVSLVLPWMSLLLLTTGLSKIHEAWLVKNYQFKTLALRSLASITLGGGVGIYMAVHDYGLYALIAQQIIVAVSALVFLWIGCKWRPSFAFTRVDILSALKYSRHTSANAAITFVNGQSDTFFASFFLGPAATGIYNAAKRLIAALNAILINGFNQVALPMFADVARADDAARSAQAFVKCAQVSAMFAAPIFFGLAALADDAVAILLGDDWAAVAPILAILSIVAFTGLLARYNMNIFLTHGKPHWQTNITLTGAIANIVLFLIVAPYGLLPLTMAYAVKTILLFPVHLRMALKLLNAPWLPYLKALWPSLAASMLMSTAVYGIGHNMLADLSSWWRTALLVPVGAVTYAALLYLFDKFGFLALLQHAKNAVYR